MTTPPSEHNTSNYGGDISTTDVSTTDVSTTDVSTKDVSKTNSTDNFTNPSCYDLTETYINVF